MFRNFPEQFESVPKYCLLISNPSLPGLVDCLVMPELDRMIDTSVDEQEPMLEEDKIAVLVSCSVYFLQKLNIYTCLYNQFSLELHKQQGESEFLLWLSFEEKSQFLQIL